MCWDKKLYSIHIPLNYFNKLFALSLATDELQHNTLWEWQWASVFDLKLIVRKEAKLVISAFRSGGCLISPVPIHSIPINMWRAMVPSKNNEVIRTGVGKIVQLLSFLIFAIIFKCSESKLIKLILRFRMFEKLANIRKLSIKCIKSSMSFKKRWTIRNFSDASFHKLYYSLARCERIYAARITSWCNVVKCVYVFSSFSSRFPFGAANITLSLLLNV